MRSGRFVPIVAAAALLATLACNTATDPTSPAAGDLTIPKASFANEKHLLPGTAGDPDCRGQTTAYAAQFGKNTDAAYRGLGGLARSDDVTGEGPVTMQELKAIIDAFCTLPPE